MPRTCKELVAAFKHAKKRHAAAAAVLAREASAIKQLMAHRGTPQIPGRTGATSTHASREGSPTRKRITAAMGARTERHRRASEVMWDAQDSLRDLRHMLVGCKGARDLQGTKHSCAANIGRKRAPKSLRTVRR